MRPPNGSVLTCRPEHAKPRGPLWKRAPAPAAGAEPRRDPGLPRASGGDGAGFPGLRRGCQCTCVCPDCPARVLGPAPCQPGAAAAQPRRRRPRAQVPRASSAAARPVSWTAPSESAPALPWAPRTPSSQRQGVLATKRGNIGHGIHGLRESLPGPPRHGRPHPKVQSLHLTVSKGQARPALPLLMCLSAPWAASQLPEARRRGVCAFLSGPSPERAQRALSGECSRTERGAVMSHSSL